MNNISAEKTPEQALACEMQARAVFDSLSAQIAILDENGVVLETNQAWRDHALQNGMPAEYDSVGENYLEICDQAQGADAEDARAIAEGIRQVIREEISEFLRDYPCHSPTDRHWYYLRAVCMKGPGPLRVVTSHEDITELKLAEEALRESREEVDTQRQRLEETNIALKVLLKQREEDKLELEKKVLGNIKELVFPYLNKLKNSRLKAREKTLVTIVSDNLDDIISPLMQRLSNAKIFLTPQEMQVAAFVKDGKTSQEISDILHISESTVSFHRKNLRKKFGLTHKSSNLRAYLMSLSQ